MRKSLTRRADQLDGELRVAAPKAGDSFVTSLAAEIPATRARRSRTAFASAVAVLVLGSFASFGGVGYAAENAGNAVSVAKKAVTSATDQYGTTKPVKPAAKPKDPTVAVKGVTASPPTKSTLPFTGLSLVGTVGLGIALLVVGFALRRRENET
jgi:hypothetical protein